VKMLGRPWGGRMLCSPHLCRCARQ
jgi:hypothetical protein